MDTILCDYLPILSYQSPFVHKKVLQNQNHYACRSKFCPEPIAKFTRFFYFNFVIPKMLIE